MFSIDPSPGKALILINEWVDKWTNEQNSLCFPDYWEVYPISLHRVIVQVPSQPELPGQTQRGPNPQVAQGSTLFPGISRCSVNSYYFDAVFEVALGHAPTPSEETKMWWTEPCSSNQKPWVWVHFAPFLTVTLTNLSYLQPQISFICMKEINIMISAFHGSQSDCRSCIWQGI